MYYGTQYYRPPFPYKVDWERDIKQISELNFNVVKLWAVWNWIEREPGIYDFGELDELVEICKKNNLKVIINTVPEGAPYWTSKGYEDTFYKKADGHILSYSGPANIPSAGWPGLCPDSPRALDLICNFIRETAKHFAKSETVIGIDVWNEPHLEPMFDYPGELLCYCDHSIEKFRTWLKRKYKSLDQLNKTWFRQYTLWEQVEAPVRFGTYVDMIDWRRFWLHNLAEWLGSKARAAKEGAPDMMVQSHAAFSGYMGALNEGGLGNELGDEFLLAKEVEVFGLSSFPLWLMGEDHVFGHLINVEIIAESCKDKDFYQTELQGGPGKSGLLGGKVPSYIDIRQWNWNVIAGGGKGVVYWQYGIEPAGMESPGFGLVNSDNSLTDRARSAADCAKKFSKEYLTNSKPVHASNGIYLSRSSDLLTYAATEEAQYNNSFKGIYSALYKRGIPCRFVHEDYLSEALNEGLKVLYLPMTLALSDNEKEKMKTFVEGGGRLIAECGTGMYSESGEMDMYYSFLNELFKMEHISIEPTETETRYAIDINEQKPLFGCMNYRQIFDKVAENIEVIAKFNDGKLASFRRTIGQGEAVFIGGFAGYEYSKSSDISTGDFIASLFESKGYQLIERMESNGILVRLLEDDTSYYVVAVNHSDEEKELTIKFLHHAVIRETVKIRDGVIIPVKK